MRRCTPDSPASRWQPAHTPTALQRFANPFPRCLCRASAVSLLAAWGDCPSRHSQTRRPAPRLLELFAAAEQRTGHGSDDTSGSGSSATGGNTGQLQPKPQAKYRRLAPSGTQVPPSKPRRWHKVSYPMGQSPAGNASPASPIPAAVQPQLAVSPAAGTRVSCRSSNGGEGQGISGGGAPGRRDSPATTGEAATPVAGRGRGQLQQQQQQQKTGQRRQQQQQGGAQRSRPGSARSSGRSRSGDLFDDAYDVDESEGEDDDEDGELLELSEEELEAMVFASARAGLGAAGTGAAVDAVGTEAPAAISAKQRRRRDGGAAATAATEATAAAAVAAAGLPHDFEALVLAAVRSGSVSAEGEILADQLRQLRKAAAAAAAAASGDAVAGGGDSASAAEVLRVSATAVANLLDCNTEAATGILINNPRYVSVLAVGTGGDGLERLRSFSGLLKVDLAETRDIVRRNPALLLAPYDVLRQKLTALANATGLSLAQATAMVTPYMFPELSQ